MNQLTKFDQFYLKIKANRWYWYFSIFCRLTLALGFIISGMVKIMGERFASGLSPLHPMGAYLEALHHTGYYYTFIGIAQVLAAVLLLIPRTVTLGALLYFPIIVNIFVLSFAVRFDGSFVTSPLMVLANLYILIWNYDKLKYLLPFRKRFGYEMVKRPKKYQNKFPFLFFGGVGLACVLVVLHFTYGYEVMPRNSFSDCTKQFDQSLFQDFGADFCDCIHRKGKDLDTCLDAYEQSKKQ